MPSVLVGRREDTGRQILSDVATNQEVLGATGSKERSFLSLWRHHGPANTLVLDF